MKELLVNIKVEQLYPHPDNPRKNLGDISELTESVKKNGIMQNLTVVPISALREEPEKQPDAEEISLKSDFHVLIGHRRLAAAKEAGLTEVPCKIVSRISKKEQVSIMLEENMQRNDLTIYEQAQGFQMMLDLGETAETIAEKTGFSKATVHHRLNIAKLDQKMLQKREKEESFQLSLKDLYELEKVKDIKTRNQILKDAYSSNQIAVKAKAAAQEEKRQAFIEKMKVMLEEEGIKPAPEKAKDERWTGKWETLKEYSTDEKLPEKISVKRKKSDELYYVRWCNYIHIIRKKEKEKGISAEEQRRKERDRKKKAIKALTKEMGNRMKDYIECIVTRIIVPIKETEELRSEILDVMIANDAFLRKNMIYKAIVKKEQYSCTEEEKRRAEQEWENARFMERMLMLLENNIETNEELSDYQGCHRPDRAEKYWKISNLLEKYGWELEEEERKLLDGTHEFYEKKEN